jgi:hypothetical protein
MANQTIPAIQVKDSNVGIGTVTPGAKLVVSGSAVEAHISNGDTNTLTLGNFSGGRHFIKSINLGVALTPLTLQASSFTFDTGNVGINTTAPNAKLNVFGAEGSGSVTVQEDLLHIGGNELGGVGGYAGIRLAGTASSSYGVYIRGVKTLAYGNYWNDALTFSVTRTNTETTIDEVMRITSAGNVGIGTTAPDARLQIRSASAPSFNVSSVNALKVEATTGAAAGEVGAGIVLAQRWWNGAPNQLIETAGIYGFKEASDGNYGGGMLLATLPNSAATMVERLRITAGGNVGIGTTSPLMKLDIYGTSGLPATSGTTPVGSLRLHASNNAVLDFGSDNGTAAGWIQSTDQADLSQFYGLLLNPRGGNVGIGTTSPQSLLHVAKAGNTNGGTILMGLGGSGTDKWSFLAGTHYNQATGSGNGTGSAGVALIGSYTTETSNGVFIGGAPYEINPATVITFWTYTSTTYNLGGTEKMRITDVGNVGIGTTAPTTKLHVVTNAVAGKQNMAAIDRTSANLIRFTNPQYSTDASMGLLLRVFPDSDARQGAGIIASGGSNNAVTDLDLFVTTSPDGLGGTSYSAVKINGLNGNVGIGTTSPANKLSVSQGGYNASFTQLSVLNTSVAQKAHVAYDTVLIQQDDAPTFRMQESGENLATTLSSDAGVSRLATSGQLAFHTGGNPDNPGWTGLGGVEAIRITATGNVGIGTTSPTDILHVYKSGANTRMIVGNNANYDQYIYFQGNNDWSIGIDASNSSAFTLSNYSTIGTNDRITVTTAGNVGIGTTAPNYPLHVKGGSVKFESQSNLTGFFKANTTQCNISFEDTTNGSNDIVYIGSIGNNFIIATTYNERVRVNGSGNLGIATTNPTAKLHVNGTVRLDNSGNAFTNAYTPAGGNTVSDVVGNNNDSRVLGTPDIWLRVNIGGTNYVFPGYTEP